ncbi:MAG TPA: hypothetical protein VLL52_03330 [Anaerolineae bacterium]|nr:hypothetical protein [Anaerolineae bacterium]
MSGNFNWQTEEDYSWDDEIEETAPPPPPSRSRRWLWIPIILVLIGGLAALIYRQINKRLDDTSTKVKEEVLSSHNFVRSIDSPNDLELFITFLSGRDPDWANQQEALLAADLLFDYQLLGLAPLPTTAPNTTTEVTLDAELRAAQVINTQPYAIHVGNGVTQTVVLSQTAIYRLGPNRWLYAPPEPEFWGGQINVERSFINATYPQRDEKVITPLLADINRKIGELCRQPAMTCQPDFKLDLTFSTDPISLDPSRLPRQPNRRLTLPTPSLIGHPTDEQSYQALFRGYAQHVIAISIKLNQNYVCCQYDSLYNALTAAQLHQLAIQPWPLNPITYMELVQQESNIFYLDQVSDAVWNNNADPLLAFALVDFIRHNMNDAPLPSIQNSLFDLRPTDGFFNWILADNLPLDEDTRATNQNWRNFLGQQLAELPPPPLPTADFVLACTPPGFPNQYGLYQYNLTNSSWATLQEPAPNPTYLLAPPNNQGFFVTRIVNTEAASTYWYQNQQHPIQTSGEIPSQTALYLQADPQQQHLLFFTDSTANKRPYEILDWPACQTGQCQLETLPGYPYWSPSGDSALLLDGNVNLENINSGFWSPDWYESDAQTIKTSNTQRLVDPFWLDDNTIGHLVSPLITYTVGNDEQTVRTTGIATITTNILGTTAPLDLDTTILTLSQLEQQITPDRSPGYLRLQDTSQNPQNADQFFLITYDSNDPQHYYLFSWNWRTNETALRAELTNVPRAFTHIWSPDGRYLTLITNNNNGYKQAQLFDQLTNTLLPPKLLSLSTPIPNDGSFKISWSPDSQWVSLVNDNYIHLIAPETQYHYPIFLNEQQQCTSAIWVDKGTS